MHPENAAINAVTAVTHADPWPYYRRLREEQPLFFDPTLNLWVASSLATVAAALAHPQLRVRPPAEPVPTALLGTAAGEVFAQLVRMTDGDFHAAHKPAVEQAARRWSLDDVAAAARAASQELADVEDPNAFMARLPVRALALLLGVPAAQRDATCEWVRSFVAGIAPGASADAVGRAVEGAAALMAQGQALGLGSVQAANRIAFMQQSLDATAALIGHTVLQLREQPAPDHMRSFVTEVERWCAPTQNTRRFAAQDLELAGQRIAAGQGVLVVLAAANRDAALNIEPERFDPQRPQPRSMGFGEGCHACPGAAIAIEIVATFAISMRSTGQFASYFGAQEGFRPLANISSPLFVH
ncbi:cytochrome P450 [uncultured Ramlibacter sp.]|uniref:cytochrome P450 n=1 Tax=uncultured Ramlibacter sp. TaxID=260755 RepID=UPI00262C2781|nr:cytochrome P450 [uncultured Ramlibacter sp.]